MKEAGDTRMRLHRYGRVYQLRLEDPADLDHVLALGESLWMATSAPVDAFACDKVFLDFVDSDHNGRIRCDEVREAVAWVAKTLTDRSDMGTGRELLRLDHIAVDQEEGRRIREAAELILSNLGRSGAEEISLADVRNTQNILAAAAANGDGIIPPDSAHEPETRQLITDILATVGGESDASGVMGVTETGLKRFFGEAEAYVAWADRGNAPAGEAANELMPLAEKTAEAYAAFAAIRGKIDEYFHLAAVIAYDPSAAAVLGPHLEKSANPAEELEERLNAAAVAPVEPDGRLNLEGPLNPAYKNALHALREKTLKPILGRDVGSLTDEEWRTVCARLSAHERWLSEKPETKVASLGLEKLREYLGVRYRDALQKLIDTDKAVAERIRSISQVEKLILYQQWLLELVNNMVSFSRLYNPEVRALFETGTLVMDGRHFALCVKVGNRAEHARVAVNSRLFVMYLELSHGPGNETREVAAAVTSGGKGNLYVGKHGVFLDRDNKLWDARVTQIIENPISFGEALTMPFVRIAELIRGQVERFAGSSQKMIEQKVTQQAATVTATVQTAAQQPGAAPKPAAASSSRTARDLLLGGGVAVAALGSSLAYITKSLSEVEPLTIVKVLSVVVLLILLPTIINAWIKLRRRDIGGLLEASGWAINARMRLTRIMRGVFTRRPGFPKGAKKERMDRLRRFAGVATRPAVLLGKSAAEMGHDLYESL